MDDEKDNIKVVFLGEIYVGKTSLIEKYVYNKFSDDTPATTKSGFLIKTLEYKGKKYTFNLWDNSGYESLMPLTKLFISNANIIVLVYDTTKKNTFLKLQFWLDFALNILGNDIYIILVGNKGDLYTNREVSEKDGKMFAETVKAKFDIVTAKNNYWCIFFENALKDYIDLKKI